MDSPDAYEASARERIADWYKVDASDIRVFSFEWSKEFGNYVIHTKFEKGGRPQNALGHTIASTLNGRRSFLFVYDAGSGLGIFQDDLKSTTAEVQKFTLDIPAPKGASRAVRLEARLQALIIAAEHVADDMDDDGKHALVVSKRLQRLLGFARTDRRDLGPGGRI